jgi:hypothetical protein
MKPPPPPPSPLTPPLPPLSPGALCLDTCPEEPLFASDGFCQDGGPGAEFTFCTYGTDCANCGPRLMESPPPPLSPGSSCLNTCPYDPFVLSDGECDDGGPGAEYSVCTYGTDCADCGPRTTQPPSPPLPPGALCLNTCPGRPYSLSDGLCDDGGPGAESVYAHSALIAPTAGCGRLYRLPPGPRRCSRRPGRRLLPRPRRYRRVSTASTRALRSRLSSRRRVRRRWAGCLFQ